MLAPQLSPVLHSRVDFGVFLNQYGLLGIGVEIGTNEGHFAEVWREQWNGRLLVCVDPWAKLDDYPDAINTKDREKDYQAPVQRLRRFGDRVQLVRKRSGIAALEMHRDSIDVAYIDGNHWRPHVDGDLMAWWRVVRPGGILAGHDWSDFWQHQIQPAVIEFAARNGNLQVYFTDEFEASWYIWKPKA